MTPPNEKPASAATRRAPLSWRGPLAETAREALQWRPAPGKWSAHEVIVHCADSETNSHMRIRYLVAEPDPTIVGYDQDRWAGAMDYHAHPLAPAMATVAAVRANTVPLLRRMTAEEWARRGRHTESGAYGAEDWLRIYAEHLEIHTRQIRRNLEAWRKQAGLRTLVLLLHRLLDLGRLPRGAPGEDFVPGRGHQDVVLDADAELLLGDVDAGLDR